MISDLVALSAPFWQITKINWEGEGVLGESGLVVAMVHFRENFGCTATVEAC